MAEERKGEAFGYQLRDWREARGITLYDVEKMSHMTLSRATVSKVERLDRLPGLDLLERIASTFGITIVIGPDETKIRKDRRRS